MRSSVVSSVGPVFGMILGMVLRAEVEWDERWCLWVRG